MRLAAVLWNGGISFGGLRAFIFAVFLSLAAVLVWRYFRCGGGWKMLRMMEAPMQPAERGHDEPHPAR